MKAYTGTYAAIAAREKCRADDEKFHLPTPKNDAENHWYWNYALRFSISDFWLGLDDKDVEGQWKTEDGDLQLRVSHVKFERKCFSRQADNSKVTDFRTMMFAKEFFYGNFGHPHSDLLQLAPRPAK